MTVFLLSDQKHERESFARRKNKMAELINTPTTLGYLFSRYAQGKEIETPSLTRTFHFNGGPCDSVASVYLHCFFLLCRGFMIVMLFLCSSSRRKHNKSVLVFLFFPGVDSLHLNKEVQEQKSWYKVNSNNDDG